VPEVSDEALICLTEQPWPGNARQLRHEVERAFVFAENGRITTDILTRYSDARGPVPDPARPRTMSGARPATLKEAVGLAEADLVRETMDRLKGNKKRVAQELGISRTYLYKILGEAAG
jgi:DNA-binding NtrC family response regulator